MKNLTSTQVQKVGKEIEAAVAKIFKKHGLELNGGIGGSYNAEQASYKIKGIVPISAAAEKSKLNKTTQQGIDYGLAPMGVALWIKDKNGIFTKGIITESRRTRYVVKVGNEDWSVPFKMMRKLKK